MADCGLKSRLQAISLSVGMSNAEKKYLRKRAVDAAAAPPSAVASSPCLQPFAARLEELICESRRILGASSGRAPWLQRHLIAADRKDLASRVSALNRARRRECHPTLCC